MMDANDVHQFWQRRVSQMEEERNQMCSELRAEVERLQGRCQQLAFEGSMMRAACAYDFKSLCEKKADVRGNVPLEAIYSIVKEYGSGMVEVPDTQKGLGALGPGSAREARKRDRKTMQMELDVALRDPSNLGHVTLDPDEAYESTQRLHYHQEQQHRRPAMNSVAAAEEAARVRDMRRQEQVRQEAIEEKNRQVAESQRQLGAIFGNTSNGNAAAGFSNNQQAAAGPSPSDSTTEQHQQSESAVYQQNDFDAPNQQQNTDEPRQQHMDPTQQTEALRPLLDENASLFPGTSVNRKRPRWAAPQFFGGAVTAGGGTAGIAPAPPQFGQQPAGLDDDDGDDMPEIEREILNERPQRQLRFNYEDPY